MSLQPPFNKTEALLSGTTSVLTVVEKAMSSGHLGTSEISNTASKRTPRQQKALRPFSNDFTSSALRYSSNIKQVSKIQTSSTSTSTSQAAAKTISSDDFPEPSYLGKICGDIYVSTLSQIPPDLAYSFNPTTENYDLIPKLEGVATHVNPTDPLRKRGGFVGLSNHSGACAINAALQTLKVTLHIMFQQQTPEEIARLTTTIQNKTPQLWKFLNDQTATEEDCRLLHQEMARQLTEDFWYSWDSGDRIAQQTIDTGYIKGAITTSIVKVLLHQLGAPQLYFEQSSENFLGMTNITHHCAQTLNCNFGEPSPMTSIASVHDLIDRKLSREERVLDDPVPSSFVFFNGMKVQNAGVLEPITLPHKDGRLITYQPKSIICRPGTERASHAFSIIKKEGVWHEINDSMIIPIPTAWEKDLSSYCTEWAQMIAYEKVEAPSSSPLIKTTPQPSRKRSENANDVKRALQQAFQLDFEKPLPFDRFSANELTTLVAPQRDYSFFFNRVGQMLDSLSSPKK